ncbi:MAG: alkaline phosphatase family protein, partial [Microgenomates group bacterium]
MINKKSIEIVEKANLNENFKKPLYQSYCFSNINNLIEYSFGISNQLVFPKDILSFKNKNFQKVILFFLDGFGWQFYEKFSDFDFFKIIDKYGIINKLTSQFPSTTSAHVTKIHTNLTVGESGLYEWNYYEPKVDAVISPLLFSFAGDNYRDTLKKFIDPKKILPRQTFYQHLKKNHIKSFIFQYEAYTPSTYSKIIFKGARVIPYKTLPEAIINLLSIAKKTTEKSYFFLYFDKIDSISHLYGPNSPQVEAQIISFLLLMEKIFLTQFNNLKNTLFLLTADHGQVETNPERTFYLNKKAPKIKSYLKKNKKGEYLVPAGSPRDMFLHINEEFLDKAKTYLEKKLKGIAEIYLTNDLINQGFFGPKISKIFLQRVGNLVILPYKNESVWWFEKNRFEQHFFGHHGGLTKEEMEIP